jgi:hypothetical protein
MGIASAFALTESQHWDIFMERCKKKVWITAGDIVLVGK